MITEGFVRFKRWLPFPYNLKWLNLPHIVKIVLSEARTGVAIER